MAAPALILFSDLDGTLLDHHTYDWSPALPALNRLKAQSIPVVLTSSKTRAEIEDLRHAMGNSDPFIVENGAAIIIPQDYFEPGPEQQLYLGASLDGILPYLHELRARGFLFTGFSDLTDGEVAFRTGLTPESAARARTRMATEPLIWQGTDEELAEFRQALERAGLQALAGGRFLHVMGQFDKADAMAQLLSLYRARWPERQWHTLALGDSPNDQAMLAGADLAVVISTGTGEERIQLPPGHPVIRSQQPGPAGWNQCVMEILDRYQLP